MNVKETNDLLNKASENLNSKNQRAVLHKDQLNKEHIDALKAKQQKQEMKEQRDKIRIVAAAQEIVEFGLLTKWLEIERKQVHKREKQHHHPVATSKEGLKSKWQPKSVFQIIKLCTTYRRQTFIHSDGILNGITRESVHNVQCSMLKYNA